LEKLKRKLCGVHFALMLSAVNSEGISHQQNITISHTIFKRKFRQRKEVGGSGRFRTWRYDSGLGSVVIEAQGVSFPTLLSLYVYVGKVNSQPLQDRQSAIKRILFALLPTEIFTTKFAKSR
jgi:hypothetical protein